MPNLLQVMLLVVMVGTLGCSGANGPTNSVNPTVRAVQPETSKNVIAAPDATKTTK